MVAAHNPDKHNPDKHLLSLPPQVHSTLAGGLLPEGAIRSVDDVYDWLRALLTMVWRDPGAHLCGHMPLAACLP